MTPEQIDAYVSRKTDETMATLGADTEHEWVGPGGNLYAAVSNLVHEVMRDMTIHISHTTEDEKRRWAAGS